MTTSERAIYDAVVATLTDEQLCIDGARLIARSVVKRLRRVDAAIQAEEDLLTVRSALRWPNC